MKNQCGNTPNDERYTPARIIAKARKVMGGIDVDPASCAAAQATVQAVEWYCVERSGLDVPWMGRVWLNPPYSHGLYARFIRHLIREWFAGRVSEAVVLTNNNTDAAATQALMSIASCWCFPRGRIAFQAADLSGKTGGICGQLLCYLGDRPEVFASVFGEIGACARPVRVVQWDLFTKGDEE